MSAAIHYGIIGCGMMGREHLRNIALQTDADVIAIYEPDGLMRDAARRLVPDVVFVDSVTDLLDVRGMNALLIASPNHVHLDQIEQILTTRPLPVLIEKPLYTSTEDEKRVEALIRAYPALAWVAMEYRYMPPIARFMAEAKDATGGIRMLTIREHRFPFLNKVGAWNRFNRNSGGTLVEKCCHFFDLMRVVIGAEPVRVMASAGQSRRKSLYE